MAQASADAARRPVRQRPARRLAIAGVLIAAAVAGLALLERYSSKEQVTTPQAPTAEPPAIATLPPPKAIAPAPNQPPPSTEPVQPLPPPPPPSVSAEPPAPSAGAPQPVPRPASPVPVVPEVSTAPAAQPVPSAATRTQPGAQAPTKLAAASSMTPGFVVQLGMFTSVENAQALRAQLEAQGVPVFLETRVVVGPFRDRVEADAARKKLQALGVSGVIAQRK